MIELKIYPSGDTIYINFKYQGIPEELPIERIEIRNKPSEAISSELQAVDKINELEEDKELEGLVHVEEEEEE